MTNANHLPISKMLVLRYQKTPDSEASQRTLFVTEEGPTFYKGVDPDKGWRTLSKSKVIGEPYVTDLSGLGNPIRAFEVLPRINN